MLNFNRRDGTPDPKAGIKAPLKPAHYDPPETAARASSATPTRPSMPSAPAAGHAAAAPSLSDAVSSAARPAPAAATSAAAMPTQMTATAGGSTLSVGINIHLKGVEISNCDALVIEGQVEATVHSKTMQIEKPGTLSGTAVIDVAEIHGEFSGELTARTRLVVHGTGRVSGTIRYGKLIVAEGGELTGDIKQLDGSDGDAQVPLLKPDWRHQSSTSTSSGSTTPS